MKKLLLMLSALLLLPSVCGGCNKIGGSKKTIFLYMCGSNLETRQGLAGKNIDEILSATIQNNMKVVIETGGAATWRSHNIDPGAIQRYEVKGGKLKLLETLSHLNYNVNIKLINH